MNTTPWHEQKTINSGTHANVARQCWTGSEKVRKDTPRKQY